MKKPSHSSERGNNDPNDGPISSDAPMEEPISRPGSVRRDERIRRFTPRNLTVLSSQGFLFRSAWSFKIETVMMPSFLDGLNASATILGLLPLLQRISFGGPQMALAHFAGGLRKLRGAYTAAGVLMSLPMLALGFAWMGHTSGRIAAGQMIGLFLTMYCLLWILTGGLQLLLGSIQGKLIPARRRGFLMAATNVGGSIGSIAVLQFWLPHWFNERIVLWDRIFLTAGIMFAIAGVMGLLLREPRSPARKAGPGLRAFAKETLLLVRNDRNFAILAMVTVGLLALRALFPHFTVYGRKALGLAANDRIWQMTFQTGVIAVMSLIVGPVADRWGNRLVLRTLVFLAALIPLTAVVLADLIPPEFGASLFWVVFAMIGVFPVSQKIITNYLLECVPQTRHSQYLGALFTLQILPLLASPLIGMLIDVVSYGRVFIGTALVIIAAAVLSFQLIEPRHG